MKPTLIASLKSARKDPNLIARNLEQLKKQDLDDKDIKSLSELLPNFYSNSSSLVVKNADELCSIMFPKLQNNKEFCITLMKELRNPLGSKMKEINTIAFHRAEKIFEIVKFDQYVDILAGFMNSNDNEILLISVLKLILKLSENNDSFDFENLINIIVPFVDIKTNETSKLALSLLTKAYISHPEKVIDQITSNNPKNAEEITEKIRCRSHPSQNETLYEESVLSRFENPFDGLEPMSGPIDVDLYSKSMSRNQDWEHRKDTLERLLCHCKGSESSQQFVKSFWKLTQPFLDCLTDSRSSLSIYACIALVGFACVCQKELDICTDSIIPKLILRTSNGTGIVASTSRIAVLKYCQNVYGDKIKKRLIEYSSNGSPDVSFTAIKAIVESESYWPPEKWKGFERVLAENKNHKSEKVRLLVSEYFSNQTPIKIVEQRSTESIRSIQRPSAFKKNHDSISTTRKKVQILKQLDSPMTYSKDIVSSEINEEKPNPEEILSISDVLAKRNLDGLLKCMKFGNQPLNEYIEGIIGLIIENINNDAAFNNLNDVIHLLTTKLQQNLELYTRRILSNLPISNNLGNNILKYFAYAFGDILIAKQVMIYSQHQYIWPFIIDIADRSIFDCSFVVEVISKCIETNQYDLNHHKITILIQKLYNHDPIWVRSLLINLKESERSDILSDIKSIVEPLYKEYYPDDQSKSSTLEDELKKAELGQDLDFQFLSSIHSEKQEFQVVYILKRAKKFDKMSIPILLEYTKSNDDNISSGATIVLIEFGKNHPEVFEEICSKKIITKGSLYVLCSIFDNYDQKFIQYTIDSLKESLMQAVTNISYRCPIIYILSKSKEYFDLSYFSFIENLPARIQRSIKNGCTYFS